MTDKDGPAGERPLRADARHNVEKVMKAAAEAFAAGGLDVPLKDIARSAGVRTGTIYNRFGSREGLLDAVVADVAAARLRAVISRAARQGTAWGRLAAFVEGMCEDQAADPAFNDVFSRRYPDAPGLQAVCDQSLAFGAGLIRDAQSAGALRPGIEASDLARIFAVNAYLVRDRPAGDDGWRRTLQFTLDGLRIQPDSTARLRGTARTPRSRPMHATHCSNPSISGERQSSAAALLDPGTLQSDLRQDGIPATVTAGSFCSSDPPPAGFLRRHGRRGRAAQCPNWLDGHKTHTVVRAGHCTESLICCRSVLNSPDPPAGISTNSARGRETTGNIKHDSDNADTRTGRPASESDDPS